MFYYSQHTYIAYSARLHLGTVTLNTQLVITQLNARLHLALVYLFGISFTLHVLTVVPVEIAYPEGVCRFYLCLFHNIWP
jgi:hypothetical protein